MRLTTLCAGVLLIVGSTGAAEAASMVAGPLFPNGVSDTCSCLAVNVSGGTRTIDVQVVDKTGTVLNSSSPVALDAGEATSVNSTTGGLLYCRFVNASSGSFRATMTCYYNGTEVVAVPAR